MLGPCDGLRFEIKEGYEQLELEVTGGRGGLDGNAVGIGDYHDDSGCDGDDDSMSDDNEDVACSSTRRVELIVKGEG